MLRGGYEEVVGEDGGVGDCGEVERGVGVAGERDDGCDVLEHGVVVLEYLGDRGVVVVVEVVVVVDFARFVAVFVLEGYEDSDEFDNGVLHVLGRHTHAVLVHQKVLFTQI